LLKIGTRINHAWVRSSTRRPIVGTEIQRGIDSALVLLREALPADTRAPLDDLRVALAPEPTSFAAWPNRLRELARVVRGLGDRARALPAETGAEAVVWAEIAHATIASHQRDLDTIAPWIEALDDVWRALPADAREAAVTIARLLDAPPTLGALPELARAASRSLAAWTDRLPDRGRAAAAGEALEESARVAERLLKSLDGVEQTDQARTNIFERVGVVRRCPAGHGARRWLRSHPGAGRAPPRPPETTGWCPRPSGLRSAVPGRDDASRAPPGGHRRGE